jgi:hypothetical protein
MRPPRVRFTVRWLMIAVAVVGMLWGGGVEVQRRSARYRKIADSHFPRIFHLRPGSIMTPREKWHVALWRKYDRLSRYPWLPVEPDPTPPEP